MEQVFDLPLDVADMQFGAITVGMGLLGTAMGPVLPIHTSTISSGKAQAYGIAQGGRCWTRSHEAKE